MRRRDFIKAAALAAGAAALSSPVAWAAPLTRRKYEIKLRQDLVYDGIFELALKTFNSKSKDISITSSYVNSDRGWGYAREHTDDVPFWYSQGEQCEVFLARGPAIAQLADAGMIVPLDDFIDKSTEMPRQDFHRSKYGSVLDSAAYRGNLWGIPLIGDTYALFCNTDLFGAAGVSDFPITWQETIETARRLTRDTNGDGKPEVFGYSQCSFQYPLQIISAGIDFVDLKNKRVLFDTDAGLEALEIYRATKAYSPPHVDFERGDMGMKVSVITNSFGKYKYINHKITRLPEGQRRANTYGDSDGVFAFCISSKTPAERQETAWRAIEGLCSERMFFRMNEMARMLPLRNSIIESAKYAAYLEKNPQAKPFLDELKWAVPKPCIPEYRLVEVVMREILYPVQEEGGENLSAAQLREHLKIQSERVNEKLRKSTW